MTTQQTTNSIKQQFKFKVNDDLQVINRVISTLDLAPSDYTYNAKEGVITTSKTTITKEFIQQKVKDLGFDFLLSNTDNKNYKVETVTVEMPYINLTSVDKAITSLYNQYRQVLGLLETKINYVDKLVTITANVRVKDFNEVDYQVALILTNFGYVIAKPNTTTSSTENEDEVYKMLNNVKTEVEKMAPSELKSFIKLFII